MDIEELIKEKPIIVAAEIAVPKGFWKWILGTVSIILLLFSVTLVVMAISIQNGSSELRLSRFELISIKQELVTTKTEWISIKQELVDTKKLLIESNAKLLFYLEKRVSPTIKKK